MSGALSSRNGHLSSLPHRRRLDMIRVEVFPRSLQEGSSRLLPSGSIVVMFRWLLVLVSVCCLKIISKGRFVLVLGLLLGFTATVTTTDAVSVS